MPPVDSRSVLASRAFAPSAGRRFLHVLVAMALLALGLVVLPSATTVSQAAPINLYGPKYFSGVTIEPLCLVVDGTTGYGPLTYVIDGDLKTQVALNNPSIDRGNKCATYPTTPVYDATWHIVAKTPLAEVSKILVWNDVGVCCDGIKKGTLKVYNSAGATIATVPFDNLAAGTAAINLPGTFNDVASFDIFQTETYRLGGAGNSTQVREFGVLGVAAPPVPTASLTKTGAVNDANKDGIAGAGEKIDYTFTVKNTGETALKTLTLTDPLVTSIVCAATTLAVGATTTCTASRVITAADLAAGKVDNTATLNFTDTSGATGSTQASTSTVLPRVSRLAVSKGSVVTGTGPNGVPKVGDNIAYTITVTNSGNSEITALKVTDPKGTPTCAATTLAPGATTTCTLNYKITATNLNAGSVTNTATATGTDPTGAKITATGATNTPLTPKADVSVVKTGAFVDGNADGVAQAGETVKFTIVVTNTGNLPLSSVAVSDPLGVPTCDGTSLATGASKTCTLDYVITKDDIAKGGAIANTATAAAQALTGAKVTASGATTVDVPLKGSLSVVKTADNPAMVAGSKVTYTFYVTNTGGVAVQKIALTDPLTSDETCPKTSLTPSEQMVCTGTYIITQADVDAGSFTNTATANGETSTGAPVTASGTVAFPVEQVPALKITKSGIPASTSGAPVSAGDTVDYTIVVENTGNVTLDPITLTDPLVEDLKCPETKLTPSTYMTCTGSHTLTAAEVAAGSLANKVSATATPPSGTPYTATGETTTTIPHEPALTVTKTASYDTSKALAVGDKVTYQITATNTGNVALSPVTVTDPFGTPTCDKTSLDPTESATCSLEYTVTQDDVDAGRIQNMASASGTSTDGVTTTAAGVKNVEVPAVAAATLAKTSKLVDTNGDGMASPGDTIDYTIVVTNTGNVTLDPVAVKDPMLASVSCDATKLAPGAKATCTGSAVVTADDVVAGKVDNNATVSAVPPKGDAVIATGKATTELPAAPAVKVEVDPTVDDQNANEAADKGENIDYTVTVTNTGNVALTSLKVVDSKGGTLTCPETTLAVGASMQCTITYPVTQVDVEAGSQTLSATVTGADAKGTEVTGTGTGTTPVPQTPALTVTKSTSDTVLGVGAVVHYSIVVNNTGNVAVKDIKVDDPLTSDEACPATELAAGAQMTCTASYVVTQANVDAGSFGNTATASGVTGANTPVTNSGSVTFPVDPKPALSVAKTGTPVDANADGKLSPGETITYTIKATNSGNVTMSGITVSDPKGTPVCDQTTLLPGMVATCLLTYTLTAADVDAGSVANTATASGLPPKSTTPVTATGSVTTAVPAKPQLSVVKSVSGDFTVGSTLTYSIVVKNSGNVALNSIAIDDPLTANETCPQTTLAAGAQMVCTATHVVTQAELDAGSLTNTATVSATAANGAAVTSESSATSPFEQKPQLTLTKTGVANDVNSNGQTDPGDTISYTITATNAGNVTLTNVAVADPKGTPHCDLTTLAPGLVATCLLTYTLTQADVDAGTVANSATASAKAPDGAAVTAPGVTSGTVIPAQPKVTVVKSSTGTFTVGQKISYSIVVTNEGNVTLSPVALDDPLTTDEACPKTSLAGGEQMTCTASHVVTQADVDSGALKNSATATVTTPSGSKTTASGSTDVPFERNPATTVSKTSALVDANGNGHSDPGEKVNYTIVVTNTGNVTMDPVTVTDPMGTPTCDRTKLVPGEFATCTLSHSLTAAEVDSGSVVNVATATAKAPDGSNVVQTGTISTAIPAVSQATVKKSVTAVTATEISYSIVVTNSGNTTLDPIVFSDPQATSSSCPATKLAAGASMTCTAKHTLTQAEIDAGTFTNTASVKVTDPSGGTSTFGGSATAPITAKPGLQVVTTGVPTDPNGNGTIDPGEKVTYTIKVTNTGNVTVTGVKVTDPLGPVDCPATPVAPGESVECTLVYTVTTTDANTGKITSTATGTGTTPGGTTVTGTGPAVTTTIPPKPGIQVITTTEVTDKDGDGVTEPGDEIIYTYAVTNTGNVTLSPVTVDSKLGTVICNPTMLAAGQTATCRLIHTLTSAEVDAGSVTNPVTITGVDPNGVTVDQATKTVTPLVAKPGLSVVTSITGEVKVGEVVTTTAVVTNTGNVTISPVKVTGSGGDLYCPNTSLAPGQQMVCTSTKVVTQPDVDAGTITDKVTATGTAPGGNSVTGSGSGTIPTSAAPDLTVTKYSELSDVNANGLPDPGESLRYTIVVTNTGNQTLNPVAVSDPMGTPTCDLTSLLPGQKATCRLVHKLTASEIAAGSLSNTASVSATAPDGSKVTKTATNKATLEAKPGVSVVKSVQGKFAAGEKLAYTFVLTNTGNVTLTPVAIDDPLTADEACPSSTLAAGMQMVCTASLTLTADHIKAGKVSNTATVTATAPDGSTTSGEGTATIPQTPKPAVTVVTTTEVVDPNGNGQVDPGEEVIYTVKVTNTGNTTLTGVKVTDKGGTVTCTPTTLAPGQTATCVSKTPITQPEIDAGLIKNPITTTTTAPDGTKVTTTTGTTTAVPAAPAGLSVVKSVAAGALKAGEVLRYTFVVTNTGNTTLTKVAISDALTTNEVCPKTTLGGGEQMTCTASYTLTQADVDKGGVTNQASGTGVSPSGAKATGGGQVSFPIKPTTSVSVQVTGSVVDKNGNGTTDPGDEVVYQVTITNSGTGTVTDLEAKFPGAKVDCPATSVAPGQKVVCTVTYPITQADLDKGSVTGSVTVTGAGPGGTQVSGGGGATVQLPVAGALKVTKTGKGVDTNGDRQVSVGDQIEYSITVQNVGNVSVTGVKVADPITEAPKCPADSLAPGEQMTCTVTYTITKADAANGSVSNTASASATGAAPAAGTISSTGQVTVTVQKDPSGGGPGDGGGGGNPPDTGSASTVAVLVPAVTVARRVRKGRGTQA